MVKIYALLNPIDNSFFYVGATRTKLKQRLSFHLSKIGIIDRGFVKAKKELTDIIISFGQKPEIIHITDVPFDLTDHCEKFYYKALAYNGHTMLQHPNQFKYTRKPYMEKVLEDHVDLSQKQKTK